MDDETTDTLCSIVDCDRPIYVKLRGWCKVHYERWQYRKADPAPIYQHQEKGHGMVKTPEWSAWHMMKQRCNLKTSKKYKDYGGRGITVYEPWLESFTEFYKYIGPRPSKKHSLDRINNDGNYEPGNVRWATANEQNSNRRSTVLT